MVTGLAMCGHFSRSCLLQNDHCPLTTAAPGLDEERGEVIILVDWSAAPSGQWLLTSLM